MALPKGSSPAARGGMPGACRGPRREMLQTDSFGARCRINGFAGPPFSTPPPAAMPNRLLICGIPPTVQLPPLMPSCSSSLADASDCSTPTSGAVAPVHDPQLRQRPECLDRHCRAPLRQDGKAGSLASRPPRPRVASLPASCGIYYLQHSRPSEGG